jgi:hypothetical protein
MFKTWAEPVVNKPWAFIATALFMISKFTGYRTLNHTKHIAWLHAIGKY